MNDLYNETIVRNGRTYYYDPDMDVYYARYTEESFVSRTAWIFVTVLLCAVCYYIEFVR